MIKYWLFSCLLFVAAAVEAQRLMLADCRKTFGSRPIARLHLNLATFISLMSMKLEVMVGPTRLLIPKIGFHRCYLRCSSFKIFQVEIR